MLQCLLLGVLKSLIALSWGRAPGVTASRALVSTAFQRQQEGSVAGGRVIGAVPRLALTHLFSFPVAFFLSFFFNVPWLPLEVSLCGNIVKYENMCSWSSSVFCYSLFTSCVPGSFSPWPGVKDARHLHLQIPLPYQVQRSPLPGQLVWPPSLTLFPNPVALTMPALLATLRDTVHTHFLHSPSRLESPSYSRRMAEVPVDSCGTEPH